MSPVIGLHHITAISSSAQGNVDFFGKHLGLRLVKKTVNFDDPGTYHLYFADRVGTLQPGKNADVVLWSHDPFSIYARAEKVWIDGGIVFDRADAGYRRHSDFLIGQPGETR